MLEHMNGPHCSFAELLPAQAEFRMPKVVIGRRVTRPRRHRNAVFRQSADGHGM